MTFLHHKHNQQNRSHGRARTSHEKTGLTLLELVVAFSVVTVIMSTIGTVFSSLTIASGEVSVMLHREMESHKAMRALFTDLQTSNTLGKDENGRAYFEIRSVGEDTDNSILFRRIEGYATDTVSNSVQAIYGADIRYLLDADGNLVRVEGGVSQVVATGLQDLSFSVSEKGIVSVAVVATVRQKDAGEPLEMHRHLVVRPQNTEI